MLRSAVLALSLLTVALPALAATEEDRRACASEQNADARIAACTRVVEDQSTVPTMRSMAHRNRGFAYANRGLFDLAIVDFDEALKLSPQDIQALGSRGKAYLQRGQYDRAIADFTHLLKLSPRSDRAFNDRGLAHLRKGDMDASLPDFEEALKINPGNVAARNNRALILARQSKFDAAISEYTEAIRLDPRYLLAYANRGRAYEEAGQIEEALADYKLVVESEARAKNDDDQRAKASAKQRYSRLSALVAEGKAAPKAAAAAERRVALIIGNSAYAFASPLRNPVNDAKALAKALRGLSFSEVREAYDVNLADFGKALKEFGDLAAGADWAIIYYAGHGIEVGGVNYLIPVDARLEQQAHVEDEAMPLTRLLSKVTAASKMQLVILDACRNNPFVGKMKRTGRGDTRSLGRGLASIEPESGVLVAYAARDGTTALDGDASENSPYAEALVKHIAEPGLEISLLFRKVRDEVLAKTSKQQEPFTYGSLPAQPFYFKR